MNQRVGVESKRVVQQDPDNAYAHNALGAARLGMGDMKEAQAQLETATQLNPFLSELGRRGEHRRPGGSQ